MAHRTPARCPVCSERLMITRASCEACGAELTGKFRPCKFCTLDEKNAAFLETFLQCRGSLKDVERALGVSYPTVRGMLNTLLAALDYDGDQTGSDETLTLLEQGEITAEEAARRLSRK